jgi:glycosyltransferase involved in cell wall biosynthesis
VLIVIARLNVGGPAHHVGVLSSMLDRERYQILVLHGQVGAGEASLADSVRARGVAAAKVRGLRPELRPHDDAWALGGLVRAIRRLRPHVVHTHTAKAGMVGRLGAVLAGGARPVIVHTYHGHVLERYFGPVRNAAYRSLERRLGRISDALIGTSAATVDDLVRLAIAPRSKFRVVLDGLVLEPFLSAPPGAGRVFRDEIGARSDDVLLTFVGRLVAIKRVDLLLRAIARARELGAPIRLAVVGDGALRPELERLAGQLGIREHVRFVGYRMDMVAITAAADIAVLSSDNEGLPVFLMEAAAAGKPAVATAVGGVSEVIPREAGLLVPRDDAERLAQGIVALAADPVLRATMGDSARRRVRERFSAERLVSDMDSLYMELIERNGRYVEAAAARPVR